MVDEANVRHMLGSGLTKSVKGEAKASNAQDIIKLLKGVPQIGARKDVDFEVLSERVFGDVKKVTVRPVVTSSNGSLRLPVDDATVTAVIEGDQVHSMDISTLTIPPHVNLEQGLPDLAQGVEAAKAIIKQQLQMAAAQGAEGATRILEAFDTLFGEANLQAEWVIARGKLCVVLSTLAGDFVVDVKGGEVFPRGTLQFENERGHKGHEH